MRPALAVALLLLPLAGCTGSGDDDRDGDGLPDAFETLGRDVVVTTAEGPRTLRATSDPEVADTDGDGLSDLDEVGTATDPRDLDTDDDGLVDGASLHLPAALLAEERLVVRPEEPTTAVGERDACDDGEALPTTSDSDAPTADGLADGDELRGWNVTVRGVTRRVASDPCHPDSDDDGLTDALERAAGSDPTAKDTDGDGVPDVLDADPVANLFVTLKLVRIELKTDKDLTGGADLRFALGVAGVPKDCAVDVATKGAYDLDCELVADVPDTTTGRDEDGALALVLPVVVTVLDDDAPTGTEGVAVSGASATATIEIDVLSGAWTVAGRRVDGGAGTVEGNDASLTFALAASRV